MKHILCIPVAYPDPPETFPEVLLLDSISVGNAIGAWRVVECFQYGDAAIAYIAKDRIPDRTEWFGVDDPSATIELFLATSGEALTYSFSYTQTPPSIGVPVRIGSELVDDSPKVRTLYSDYHSQRYDERLPVTPDAPFRAVYLVWCHKPLVTA